MPLDKKLDLKSIKSERIKEEREQGLLGFPVQVNGISGVTESIEKLHELIESKEDYDFDQLKIELANLKAIFEERLDLAPLTKSLDEFTTQLTSTQTSTTKQNKEDLSKLIKSIEDTIKGNQPIVNVKAYDIRAEYGAADFYITGSTAYISYIHPTGKWYILKQTGTEEGTFRYAVGTKDYEKAWKNKTMQKYYQYNEVRL